MTRIVVEECTDRNRLLAVLGNDRVKNAYLIGSTAPGYAEHARWFQVLEKGIPRAVVGIYEGLSVPAIFAWGMAEHVALLISRIAGQFEDRMLIHRYPEHAAAFQGHAEIQVLKRVVRMTLTPGTFKPAEGEVEVVRLSHKDTAGIMRLYTSNPDNFFEPYQLESGYYYGVKQEGNLVSVAGIHLVHQALRFAMLGNVVTSPSLQGRGLGSIVTSRLCRELLRFSELLVLDVPMESGTAIKVFSKLGFTPQFYYDQAQARRVRKSMMESQK